jgi:hypothetical protein
MMWYRVFRLRDGNGKPTGRNERGLAMNSPLKVPNKR